MALTELLTETLAKQDVLKLVLRPEYAKKNVPVIPIYMPRSVDMMEILIRINVMPIALI